MNNCEAMHTNPAKYDGKDEVEEKRRAEQSRADRNVVTSIYQYNPRMLEMLGLERCIKETYKLRIDL